VETADIVEIYQLQALCHHSVDYKDQSMFSLVFTEDARFDGRGCGGPLYVGLDAIKAFFAQGKPPHPAAHHMTNCWVREEGGRVLVKMKWMVPDRGSGRMFGGDNDDWVVRTAEGWRIKERVATLRYPEGNVLDGGSPAGR
jgi:SnoaL-like protein